MDDRRVRQLLDSLVEAWNRRDWPAFARCFAEDADYVTGEADRWSGRDAIRRGMESLFATGGTGGTAEIARCTLRVLGPGIAVAHLHWRLVDSSPVEDEGFAGQGVSLFVVALHGDQWLVEAAQNTDAGPID